MSNQTRKIVWLFNCIGTPTSLLYWNGILPRYLERFPHSQFFCARPPSKPIPGTNKSVIYTGALRIPLGPRPGSYERQLVFASPRILSLIRGVRPDVIVVMEFLSYALYLALFRRFLGKTKILLLLESDPIRGIASRRKFWTRSMRRFIAARMDLFLTNNEAGGAYLVDELGVARSRIMVHPFLVSAPETADDSPPEASTVQGSDLPEQVRGDLGETVFLYVGQLIERKGVEQWLDAIRRIQPELRERARFWLLGDGPLRSHLEQKIRDGDLASCVRLLGLQPYECLGLFYRAADVFVMPTLDDYRALVGFEAISFGLPLLHSVYDGAVSELVQNDVNGFAINPRDPDELAARMEWMIENPRRVQEMGTESARLAKRFTLPAAVEGLCKAIQRCGEIEDSPNG